ncbi:unnamed protein product [Ambrosiozyma monospora]|uniref:Unnamed protein product n=1 Tax=Ambrosiozyma monospora TaxID=43982 RepID=A0A9W6Z310_AMBMO|nr:unnamed protein product [Ambrosiozyma monospora]
MDAQVSTFMEITSVEDPQVASNFLEMSGGDIDTAVSLFFEHGADLGATTTAGSGNNHNNDITSNNDAVSMMDTDNDAAMAERLQNEMYQQQQQQDEVRRPIEPMHDQLVHFGMGMGGMGIPGMGMGGERGMYGHVQRSIFNQTEDNDYVNDEDNDDWDDVEDDDAEDENGSDTYEILDENGDIVETAGNGGRHRRHQTPPTTTSAQRRLANIFRPPFDLIEKLDLDSAKLKARGEKKWILINIQDVTDFSCQCLNRDFWKSNQIKDLVRENFVFLQYQHDSPNGQMYSNLYPFTDFPHIAILDPMTGERLKMWSTNPEIHKWIEQVVDFMDRFSLDKSKKNPIVKHQQSVNVEALTEEQQLELAMKKSMGAHEDVSDDVVIVKDDDGESSNFPITLDDDSDEDLDGDEEVETANTEPAELTYSQKIAAIEPIDHPDPTGAAPKETTRIQIRSGIDGKRVVKKFALNEPVLKLYQVVKFQFKDSVGDKAFTLTMQRKNLFDDVENTIEEAGLKNASVLLEVIDDEED